MTNVILRCSSCKIKNPEGAKFCKNCGKALKEKTFIYNVKARLKLLIVAISFVLILIFIYFTAKDSDQRNKEVKNPVSKQFSNITQTTSIKSIENCVDYGEGYYCSPLQKDLVTKYPGKYKYIEKKCNNQASSFDNNVTVYHDGIQEITAYDEHFIACIKKHIALTKSTADYKKTSNKYSLTVIRTPKNARVRVLNIKPKYSDGIMLKEGKYHIEVSKKGYETSKKWVALSKDNTFVFSLKKNEPKRKLDVQATLPQKMVRNIVKKTIPLNKVQSQRKNKSVSKKPGMSHLTEFERNAIEKVCNYDKNYKGSADYYQCIRKEIRSLRKISQKPSMVHLTEFRLPV